MFYFNNKKIKKTEKINNKEINKNKQNRKVSKYDLGSSDNLNLKLYFGKGAGKMSHSSLSESHVLC